MRRERDWPEGLVQRLQLAAQIFANALARKRADQALRESEERLSLAAESAEAGRWVLACRTGIFWVTDKARAIFGYAPDEVITMAAFQAVVHPEDCEIQAGGVAAMWAAKGHKVKLVSVTNGDIGHWREAGGPLARRRTAEVARASEILGTTSQVLDNHDGELEPTLENRRKITRLIREWNADIVMSPRPDDYHPDHRYTAVLVQDAAYMVTVPFFGE
jgi:PAS domain-containing protein